jgi:hypothetical protein
VIVASLRYFPLGQIHVSFGGRSICRGIANHRLAMSVQFAVLWLGTQDPQRKVQALLTGTVWTDQPSFRWLAGPAPVALTLRGHAGGEELVVRLTEYQPPAWRAPEATTTSPRA